MQQIKNMIWLCALVFLFFYSIYQLDHGLSTGVMEISNRHSANHFFSLDDDPAGYWIGAAIWLASLAGFVLFALAIVFRGKDM